jgi:hypothetical protein
MERYDYQHPSEVFLANLLSQYFVRLIFFSILCILQGAVVGTITGNCRFYDASGK